MSKPQPGICSKCRVPFDDHDTFAEALVCPSEKPKGAKT